MGEPSEAAPQPTSLIQFVPRLPELVLEALGTPQLHLHLLHPYRSPASQQFTFQLSFPLLPETFFSASKMRLLMDYDDNSSMNLYKMHMRPRDIVPTGLK